MKVVRLALAYVLGREERPQLFAQRLPGRILVAAGDRIGKYPQGHRAKAGEAGEHGALLGGRGPLGLLDGLERADRGQDGAGLGFLAAGGLGVWGHGGRAPLEAGAWGRVPLLTTARSGMVEKVMVRLLDRCTVIKSQQVFAAPAGSLEVVWRGERTHGWPSRAVPGAWPDPPACSDTSACVPEMLQTPHDGERPFFVDRNAEQPVPFPDGPVAGIAIFSDVQHGVPPCRWGSSGWPRVVSSADVLSLCRQARCAPGAR